MKLDSKVECPKCGFRPTFQKDWKIQYKDECFGVTQKKCGWADSEVKEHLHQICPTCDYTFAVETEDYDRLKGKEAWSTGASSTVGKQTTPPVTNGGRGGMGGVKADVQPLIAACNANRNSTGQAAPVTRPVTTVYTPPTPAVPARCRTCPVDGADK